jgi:putative DNA primase/helicase
MLNDAGIRWRRDNTGAVMRRAKQVARSLYTEAGTINDDARRMELVKHAKRTEGRQALESMISLARSELPVSASDLDRNAMLLNLANGTLDLKTGELREHQRDDFITKLAPVNYDPGAECPGWLRFLARILPDSTVREFIRRFVGYSLTGQTTEQCLLIQYGVGANGKSTLREVLRRMFGDYAQHTAFKTFLEQRNDGVRNDLAGLAGSRFVTASEGMHGRAFDEGVIKDITGGEPVKARFLYGEYFEYFPQFKVWLATNHKPVIRGTDEGIWRRIKLIPFEVTIPEQERDPNLVERLTTELPGILNWALDGCLTWQRDGLGIPAAVQTAGREYRCEQDVLGTFLSERCRQDPHQEEEYNALYQAYSAWCEQANERAEPSKAFGQELANRGFVGFRRGGRMLRRGLVLLAADEADRDAQAEMDRAVEALTRRGGPGR